MSRNVVFILVCFAFGLFAMPARAADDKVCVYKHDNFHDEEQCFKPGDEVSDLRHTDVESIRISGDARAILYSDKDFRGTTMEVSADMPDLKRLRMSGKDWHDHIGSLRVVSDSYHHEYQYDREKDQEDRAYIGPVPVYGIEGPGVCVYNEENFRGRSQCWASGADLSDLGSWDDDIASVRVFGGGEMIAYRDKRFHGDRIVIDRDTPNLHGWKHEASSVEVK